MPFFIEVAIVTACAAGVKDIFESVAQTLTEHLDIPALDMARPFDEQVLAIVPHGIFLEGNVVGVFFEDILGHIREVGMRVNAGFVGKFERRVYQVVRVFVRTLNIAVEVRKNFFDELVKLFGGVIVMIHHIFDAETIGVKQVTAEKDIAIRP